MKGGSILFEVSSTGPGSYRYDYFVSGYNFQVGHELDIRFAPDLYGSLKNAVASPGFDVILLQPNNPPGLYGDYSALAITGNSSGRFSVEFSYFGAGLPGGQPFFINEYDPAGTLVRTLVSSYTSPADASAVPEPASGVFEFVGVLVLTAAHIVNRGRRRFTSRVSKPSKNSLKRDSLCATCAFGPHSFFP